jgi:hypothetical protein
MSLFMIMLKLNLKYLSKRNLRLDSCLLVITVLSLLMLDYTVFIFALKDLGLRSMILRKAKLVQNLPYLNMLLGKGENLLKGLSLLAIIVAKLVITNLATSS